MPILRFCLLLLMFVLRANGDDGLIQTACHNANAPETCIRCLKSDNRSSNADKFTIVTLITECLIKHATNLGANFSALASRKVYKDCSQLYSQATKELEFVAKRIKSGDYDGADRNVYAARVCNFKCYSEIRQANSAASTTNAEIKDFEELCEAAMRMIERF